MRSKKERLHTRFSRPDVEVDSPLIDCSLLNLSASGLAIETNVGLRLGVPYPFRLRDGEQRLSTEARVCWCRLVRTETVEGESRAVFRAGAAFVDWQTLELEESEGDFERQVDDTIDQWLEQSRVGEKAPSERKVVRLTPQRQVL